MSPEKVPWECLNLHHLPNNEGEERRESSEKVRTTKGKKECIREGRGREYREAGKGQNVLLEGAP